MPDRKSDSDFLLCSTNTNVIENWSDWEQDKLNLFMLQEGTAPGYCQLQALRNDAPMFMEHLMDPRYTYDSCNRVVLKNTSRLSEEVPGIQWARNGPALSHHETLSGDDFDIVHAFRCKTWPVKADQWTTKHRHRNWPTQSLIQQAVRSGIFVVPVGYKLSKTENLEWRISFSMTERLLMFSLNIIQLKCYGILKMIMKYLVIPSVGESISSYHCKTALFHCIEDTGVEFWTENNLLQGINLCLSLLLTCVRNEFCPHFILPESNLFAGKIDSRNKVKLVSILRGILESSGRFLLLISTEKLGLRLKTKFGYSPIRIPMYNSTYTMRDVCATEFQRLRLQRYAHLDVLLEQIKKTPIEAVQMVKGKINVLCDRLVRPEICERQAIRVFLKILTCLLGSLLTSMSLSRQNKLSRKALKWFFLIARHDISSQLELASVFVCSCNFEKAELILRNVEYDLERKKIQAFCFCNLQKHPTSNFTFAGQMIALENAKARSRLIARCIMFSPQEIHCTPPALRYEMYRSAGDDRQHRHPVYDKWMDLAVVDPLPYLYYLQYLTYDKLERSDINCCHYTTLNDVLGRPTIFLI